MVYRVASCDPIQLVRLCWDSIPAYSNGLGAVVPSWPSLGAFFSPFAVVAGLHTECALIVALAVLLTLLRYRLQAASQDWIIRWHVHPRYSHKLPECIWKLLYYGGAWLFALYVHLYTDVKTLDDPMSMWDDWTGRSARDPPPYDTNVLIIYALQTAFYLHSIYATLFMDMWRADSWVMFIHHFVALALLAISYAENYTLAGALVLFLQDNSDAALEITKLCVYLKRRSDGRYYYWLEKVGNGVLYFFAALWVVFRLYWFSTKLLYATLYGGTMLGPKDSVAFPILGVMLASILFLNLFWFNFIVRMVIRVWTTGVEPEDNREYDTVAGAKKKTKTT